MNGRKAKAIRKKALEIIYEWIKTMVSPEEAKKLTYTKALELLPDETHVYANRQLFLSAFSFKWIIKKIKKIEKEKSLNLINLKDIQNEL